MEIELMAQMALVDRRTDGVPHSRLSLGAVGGLAVALGSLSVVVTSVFYFLSPAAAIAPVLVPLPDALAAAAAGEATMRIAGTSGVFGNLVMAVGCLLLAIERAQASEAVRAAGWAAILMSIVVFEVVDGLTGFVLSQAAADPAGAATFHAFRNLYAAFFLAGTALFGLGALLALSGGVGARLVGRVTTFAGMAGGAVALCAALATFIGFPLGAIVGGSVGFGAVVFVAVGILITVDAVAIEAP